MDAPPGLDELARTVLDACARGLFPMADPETGAVHLYDPDPRGVLPLEGFRVPRTLRQRVRQGRFKIRCDSVFGQVIRACADPRREGGWIDPTIVAIYTRLHESGFARSVEAWLPVEHVPTGAAQIPLDRLDTGRTHVLVGGLYGVAHNGLFAGESMFSDPALGGTDASKVCLVHLVSHLRARGYTLLDTQFSSPHLERFGCVEIDRDEYRRRLARAMEQRAEWGEWDPRRAERDT